MSRKTTILSSTLFTIALVSSPFANAQDRNNPLHPSYYMGKTAAVAISTASGAKQYVDSRNPLHPSYAFRAKPFWFTPAGPNHWIGQAPPELPKQ